VLVALVFVALAGASILFIHPASAAPVWSVSLDASNTSQVDVSKQTAGSFAKTFRVGAIVNASVANPISGIYGWQYQINYDPNYLVPQGDPSALSPYPDGAENTIAFGAQTSAGTANWAGKIGASQAFGSSTLVAPGQIQVFLTFLGATPAATLSAQTLLASVAFEIVARPPTPLLLYASDIKFVDNTGTLIPSPVVRGTNATETITNNPPVARFIASSVPDGSPLCVPFTGLNCSAFAVNLDGSTSSDVEDGTIASPSGFFWDFGDGTQDLASSGSSVIHDFGGSGTFEVSLRVVDSLGATGAARDGVGGPISNNQPSHTTQSVVTVPPTPLTASVDCGTGQTAGKPFNCTVSATGGTSPYTGTGIFSITEPTKGSKIESFVVMDSVSVSAIAQTTVTIAPQPLIVTVTCPSNGVTVGKPFNCTVDASGGTSPYSGTGTFSVTETSKGSKSETFTVTDANSVSASGAATVNVAPQPLVVSASCPTSGLTTGKPFNCSVTATGGTGPYTGTGTVSKTEPVKGTFSESFTVTDSNGISASGTASVTIAGQPLVVTVSCPTSGLTAGKPFTCNVSASGGTTPYTGTGAKVVTQPTKGTFVKTFTVTDGNQASASGTASVTIAAQPLTATVTCPSSGVTAGKPFNCTVEAVGGTAPYTGTGVFSRTEDVKGMKTESFTVVDSNSLGVSGSTIVTVAGQPFVATATCPSAGITAGKPFTCNVSATGGTGPYTGTGTISRTESIKGAKTESFTVTDANGVSAAATKDVIVSPQPLVVTVACPATSTPGVTFSCVVTATGGTLPYTGTGSFTVTETTKGIKTESFSVTDANTVTASGSASVSIQGTPVVVTVTCPSSGITTGKPFNCTVEVTGGTAPYTGSGSFTRTEATKGTKTETFSVTDANGATASGQATVTVGGQPLVVTATCPSSGVTAGKPFDCIVAATGGTSPYTGTGTISRTEAVKGPVEESFTVTDANGASALSLTSVSVSPQPLVVSVSCPSSATAGLAFDCTVTATGGTAPYTGTGTISRTESLKGVVTESFDVTDSNSVTATGSATVSIAGTPLVVTVTCPSTATVGKPFDCTVEASGDTGPYSGTGSFSRTESTKGVQTETFSVTDANSVTASSSATVTVTGQPLIVTVSCPSSGVTAGKPFNCDVSATGGTSPYVGTGSVSRTATVKGTATESFTVTDSNSVSASASTTVDVTPQPLVVSVSCPANAAAGVAFDCTVSATGGTAPYSGTGTLSVTEPLKGAKTESFTVTDANGVTASASATVNVAGTPLIVTVTCPATASIGLAFQCTVDASGDTAPYSGIGAFSITETLKGSKVETFSVTDANGVTASGSATVAVAGEPLVVAVNCPGTADAGVPFFCSVTATGGTQPYSGTGNFSVTEPSKGSKTESFIVTDANGAAASGSSTVVVAPQPLSTNFTLSASPTVGQPVIFTAAASGGTAPYSFIWDFGDSTTGTGSPVTHTFPSSQLSWNVTLATMDANGATTSTTQQITLVFVAPPVASFTESVSTVPTGTIISFDASGSTSGGTITSYSWDFGDSSSGTGVTTNHSYAVAGNYTVTLTITDSNGKTASSTSLKVIQDRPPTAAFTFTPTGPITGQTVSFDASSSSDTDGSIVAYAWNFGDLTTGSGVTTSHVYTSAGTFNITLIVTDNSGSTGTASASITVSPGNVAEGHASLARWSAQPSDHHESLSKAPTNTFSAFGVNDGNQTVWVYVQFHLVSDQGASLNLYTEVVQLSPGQTINGKTDSMFTTVFTPPGTGSFSVTATIFYSANSVAPPIGSAAFTADTASAKTFSITVVP